MLANDVAQTRQSQLVNRALSASNRDYRFRRINNFVPKHCIDFNCDTVSRNRFLLLSRNSPDSNVDDQAPFDAERHDPVKTGSANSGESTKAKNYTTFIFPRDSQTGYQKERYDRD